MHVSTSVKGKKDPILTSWGGGGCGGGGGHSGGRVWGRQEGGAHEKAPPDGLPNFSEICVE